MNSSTVLAHLPTQGSKPCALCIAFLLAMFGKSVYMSYHRPPIRNGHFPLTSPVKEMCLPTELLTYNFSKRIRTNYDRHVSS